jgi:hypothetical protein
MPSAAPRTFAGGYPLSWRPQVAPLVGLAPYDFDSGKLTLRRRYIKSKLQMTITSKSFRPDEPLLP